MTEWRPCVRQSELRRLMNRLRTPVLDKFGLAEAIEDVASQLRSIPGAPEIEYRHAVQFKRLEPTLENSLFRIAQEAMTNACRHSKSEKVRVTAHAEGDEVTLEVRDWGMGFRPGHCSGESFWAGGHPRTVPDAGRETEHQEQTGPGTVVRVKFPVIEAMDEE